MIDITFYGSDEEMWEDLGRAMKEADSRVRPAQAAIKPYQCYINMRYGPDLPIFGEILDYKTLGVDSEEQTYINESYEQPHMRFYRPCKAYSVACEDGEFGDVHLSEIDAIIGPELLEYYRELGWRPPARENLR